MHYEADNLEAIIRHIKVGLELQLRDKLHYYRYHLWVLNNFIQSAKFVNNYNNKLPSGEASDTLTVTSDRVEGFHP